MSRKGKSDDDCNNYIRVLAKVDADQLLICKLSLSCHTSCYTSCYSGGTNAYNPRCRNYARNNESVYEVIREFSGKGYCPYDPTNNSTAIYAGKKWASWRVLAFYYLQKRIKVRLFGSGKEPKKCRCNVYICPSVPIML